MLFFLRAVWERRRADILLQQPLAGLLDVLKRPSSAPANC